MKPQNSTTSVALNLEVHILPVSDVERSKQFYQRLGWRLDEDVSPAKSVRIVQFTPPGSGCSVTFGNGIGAAAPGSAAAEPGLASPIPVPKVTEHPEPGGVNWTMRTLFAGETSSSSRQPRSW